jgi:hypothetical protein
VAFDTVFLSQATGNLFKTVCTAGNQHHGIGQCRQLRAKLFSDSGGGASDQSPAFFLFTIHLFLSFD